MQHPICNRKHGTVAVSVTLENERGERMREKRICFLLFAPCAKIGQVQGVARLALLIFESELIGRRVVYCIKKKKVQMDKVQRKDTATAALHKNKTDVGSKMMYKSS